MNGKWLSMTEVAGVKFVVEFRNYATHCDRGSVIHQ